MLLSKKLGPINLLFFSGKTDVFDAKSIGSTKPTVTGQFVQIDSHGTAHNDVSYLNLSFQFGGLTF